MINRAEADEKRYLEEVKHRLASALERLGGRVSRYARGIREQKAYIWEHKADMDHVEKISARESADQMMRSGEVALAARRRLERLIQSPFFGRIDFHRDDDGEAQAVYVGIHSFTDDAERTSLVFDWRAPISTMFYDCEIGPGGYRSPTGNVRGRVTLKRQYRIRHGQMEFMLESGLSILDEVLQEELSRTSDERMKSIVATIQRDQNSIIRNEDSEVLIIQGVAGSGKTSIALHRIAFLLYRYQDTLSSGDILIVSPNRVFADFISDVLPELGEERIAEVGMEEIASELLERKHHFQTSLEQAESLFEKPDEELRRRIGFKSTRAFLDRLERYARHVEQARFRAVDLAVGDHVVEAALIGHAFGKSPSAPLPDRLRWVAEWVEHEVWTQRRRETTAAERKALRAAIGRMPRRAALGTLYREFYDWIGEPGLLAPAGRSALEYSDVFPLIYLKLRLEGPGESWRHIRHLVIDEMQDYTPVQYAVISLVFPCNKTILGDVNQSLAPWSATTAEEIGQLFRHSECMKLRKSYRSSYEITRFAQGIIPNADLQVIERHGRKPEVVRCRSAKEELDLIAREAGAMAERGYRTLGIICKTQRQARRLHRALSRDDQRVHLLTASSNEFVRGVVVCSVHLAKGLEFDQVILPQATAENYATELDRGMLYVACTRAMHDLIVTCVGPLTTFILDDSLYVSREEASHA